MRIPAFVIVLAALGPAAAFASAPASLARGVITGIDPQARQITLDGSASYTFPDTAAIRSRLASLLPGETVTIGLARPGDDASARTITLVDPLYGYPTN